MPVELRIGPFQVALNHFHSQKLEEISKGK